MHTPPRLVFVSLHTNTRTHKCTNAQTNNQTHINNKITHTHKQAKSHTHTQTQSLCCSEYHTPNRNKSAITIQSNRTPLQTPAHAKTARHKTREKRNSHIFFLLFTCYVINTDVNKSESKVSKNNLKCGCCCCWMPIEIIQTKYSPITSAKFITNDRCNQISYIHTYIHTND